VEKGVNHFRLQLRRMLPTIPKSKTLSAVGITTEFRMRVGREKIRLPLTVLK
jgi:hypothetical protein